eukprot:scaffold190644_cov17-Prasinocladus_malaysianus.AAC.1
MLSCELTGVERLKRTSRSVFNLRSHMNGFELISDSPVVLHKMLTITFLERQKFHRAAILSQRYSGSILKPPCKDSKVQTVRAVQSLRWTARKLTSGGIGLSESFRHKNP